MRIDSIDRLSKRCTGCLACVDSCPVKCIRKVVGADGFVYAAVDTEACIDCGRCFSVCPLENNKKQDATQHLYAAYAKDAGVRLRGSSGGIFELLARSFLSRGFYVCGAAFEDNRLRHRIISGVEELDPLLKSKYVQSDTEGIYVKLKELLSGGDGVFFCGTPCQCSALLNFIPERLRGKLFVADIVCHGVPSQKTFDAYIESIERQRGGKVRDFSFRVKDNKYRHAHGYSYSLVKNNRSRTVNGIYTDSSFYNAFKKYYILRDGCYECEYATLGRVSDITLADFWGIEKYGFCESTDRGVSMVITNGERGEAMLSAISDLTVNKEFPLQYGIDSNWCLTNPTKKPAARDRIIEELTRGGYDSASKKYFKPKLKQRLMWLLPASLRNLARKIRR